ncbi:MAG: Phytochrome, two-component sensor histidine kinase [uncultured Rubrobacteraceae bacterium]|uniref:Sensor-like histidine kinase SenX3 n=1 Tax=uncultured Rubrobacteraceae bacterium TaxID=349277 RepID=A0A6J4QP88_9ACTN|nr:MAG: Phytochrome, two-component sensor histidine kinase [uncultured Rubrobacteraceae bacterium]
MRRAGRVFGHLRRAAVAYAVLLVALALTFLAYQYVRQNVEASARDQFDETVMAAQDAIDRQMNSYVEAMLGTRGLFYASNAVEEGEWDDYGGGIDLEERYEGMQILGYARRVEPADREDFEDQLMETLRDEGLGDRSALRPEGERPEYFPLAFVEPLDEVNGSLLGYDAYPDPEYRVAMDRARDTGQAQATGKVYVLTETPEGSRADLALEPGLVVYLPVYSGDASVDTVEGRQSALEGFIVAYLEAEGLLRGTLESFDPSIDFEIYDGEDLGPNSLLYDDDGVLRASESQEPVGFFAAIGTFVGSLASATGGDELSDLRQIDLAGREYDLYFEALPGASGERGSRLLPLFVLLSGLAVSLLLFGVTFMLVRSRLLAEKAGRDLEDANHELEATNRELEAFSYSVSHDLRAPLRSIDGFSQILVEDYADEIDEEGRDYLGRVRSASQRMGMLIDDILGLSRVTRGSMERKRLDLGALAEQVAEELRETGPERKVEFSAQKGLEVWGDPTLLRVALVNLIGNAWKFTAKNPEARVEFGLSEGLSHRGRVPVYYVRDNGAGFDQAYAGKLFGAFQRLHGADEFEGTGIGLATVQRVVHRHGGRIWAEGEVGRGATFYFTLRPGLRIDPTVSQKEDTTK